MQSKKLIWLASILRRTSRAVGFGFISMLFALYSTSDAAAQGDHLLPQPNAGWTVKVRQGEEENGHVKYAGLYENGNRGFAIEVDVGGPIATSFAKTWGGMVAVMQTTELSGVPFIVEQSGYTTLLDRRVMVRAYAVSGTDESEAIEAHLDALDVTALKELTK